MIMLKEMNFWEELIVHIEELNFFKPWTKGEIVTGPFLILALLIMCIMLIINHRIRVKVKAKKAEVLKLKSSILAPVLILGSAVGFIYPILGLAAVIVFIIMIFNTISLNKLDKKLDIEIVELKKAKEKKRRLSDVNSMEYKVAQEELKVKKEEAKKIQNQNKYAKLSQIALNRAENLEIVNVDGGIEAVGIIFNEKSRVYKFGPKGNVLNVGDVVSVKDGNGALRVAPVVLANHLIDEASIVKPFKEIEEVLYQTTMSFIPSVSKDEEDSVVEEAVSEEVVVTEEAPAEEVVEAQENEEQVVDETVVEEAVPEEVVVTEEAPAEEVVEAKENEEPVVEDSVVEEAVSEEVAVTEEAPAEDVEAPVEEVVEEAEETPVEEETLVEGTEVVAENVETPVEEEVVVTEEAPAEEVVEEKENEEPVEEIIMEMEDISLFDENNEEESDDEDDEEEVSNENTASPVANDTTTVEVDEETGLYRITKITRSIECRICSLPEEIKNYYSDIKNALITYGTKPRMAKSKETFSYKRNKIAVIKFTKSSIYVYLALDPNSLLETKYKGKDVSNKAIYASTPFLFKVKTARKAKWCLELIDQVAKEKGLTKTNSPAVDYAKDFPMLSEEEMIEKGYYKVTVIETTEAPKGFGKVEKIK